MGNVGYEALAVATRYWRPKSNYIQAITENIRGRAGDEDFVVVSEKALSTARMNIVDESVVKPSLGARLIAGLWMRIAWGYILWPWCGFNRDMVQRLRTYPADGGSRHKQVALIYSGLLQALLFGSEGGIDGSNMAYSYVSLPLKDAESVAEDIRQHVWLRLQKHVFAMIVDTDKTYSFRNFHFTPRPEPIKGIHSFGGVFAYLIGRMLRLRRRATPIAVAGCRLSAEEALRIANVANRARGHGAGRTVWDMAERFGVGLDEVSWEMLETVKHKPIVIVRRKRCRP